MVVWHVLLYLACATGVYTFNVVNYSYVPYLVDVAFIALSLYALVTGLILRARVHVEILNPEEHAECGIPFHLQVRVVNRSYLPLTSGKIVLSLKYSGAGKTQRKRLAFACGGKSSEEYEIILPCEHCETIYYSIKRIYIYDHLRLLVFPIKRNITDEIIVFPHLPSTEIMNRMTNINEGETLIYSQSKPGDDPTEIFAIREYQGGDPIRNIHWKLTSKTGRMMVKEYALPLQERDAIVIDMYWNPKFHHCRLDEIYALLYGLVYAMTSRGYGFTVHYLNDKSNVSTRVETQLDIEKLFVALYEIGLYEENHASATELYVENHEKTKNRVFYVTTVLNDAARERMLLLEETGPVYYLIPDELVTPGLPVPFSE